MHRIKITGLIYLKLFAILNILGLITCFINIRLGIVSSIFILILFMYNYGKKGYFQVDAFLIYLIFSIVSVIAYAWNGRPFVIFIQAISFNFIPSLLYYLGGFIVRNDKEEQWIYHTLNAFCFMMLIGTITYLLIPGFYYNYLGQSIENYAYGLGDYRYGSFISSIALGSVCSVSVLLYFSIFNKLVLWQRILYLPLILMNVVMCMQRSAWIVTSIALIVALLHKFANDRKARVRIFALSIVLIFFLVIVWHYRANIFTSQQLSYFERRIGTLTFENMSSSRNSQWSSAIKIFKENPIIGYGLGSCGQKAAPFGMEVVTDGNHLRILAEIGLVGFAAFIYVNIRGIIKALKRGQFYFALAIVLYNLAAIGSPIFDQYYASFVYWIILGCASTTIANNKQDLNDNLKNLKVE